MRRAIEALLGAVVQVALDPCPFTMRRVGDPLARLLHPGCRHGEIGDDTPVEPARERERAHGSHQLRVIAQCDVVDHRHRGASVALAEWRQDAARRRLRRFRQLVPDVVVPGAGGLVPHQQLDGRVAERRRERVAQLCGIGFVADGAARAREHLGEHQPSPETGRGGRRP